MADGQISDSGVEVSPCDVESHVTMVASTAMGGDGLDGAGDAAGAGGVDQTADHAIMNACRGRSMPSLARDLMVALWIESDATDAYGGFVGKDGRSR